MPHIPDNPTPAQVRTAYNNGLIGCHVDAKGAPPDIRRKARYATDQALAEFDKPVFGAAAPALMDGPDPDGLYMPFRALAEIDRETFQVVQAGPNCTSHAARRMAGIQRAIEALSFYPDDETHRFETYEGRDSSAIVYRARGDNGPGMAIATGAKALKEIGFALSQTYCDGRYDFTTEAKSYAWAKFGRRGIPSDLRDELKPYRFRVLSYIGSMEELDRAISAGLCCMVGATFGLSPTPHDGFITGIRGHENHARTIEGGDFRRERRKQKLYFFGNSWGLWNAKPVQWPEEYGPWIPGQTVLTENDVWRFVRQRACWVGSSAAGYPDTTIPDYWLA